MYVRYYEKVDANEIRDQLLKCLDTALRKVVYRALEVDAFDIDVDTITQEKNNTQDDTDPVMLEFSANFTFSLLIA